MTSWSNFGAASPGYGSSRWQGACGGRFRPLEIAALVVAFAAWWPLGLGLLAFRMAQRRGYDFGAMVDSARQAVARRSPFRPQPAGWQPFATGNSAFDDWRNAEMARLEEEKRKLDAARKEFGEHLDNLRRARDKDEFDSFMAARQKPAASA